MLVVFGTASFVTTAPNNGICYNKNMVQDPAQLACNSEAEVSSCCSFGAICLSNALCQTTNPKTYTPYFTGTCTDYMWNSSSTCPEICNNDKNRQAASHHDLLSECISQIRPLKGKANLQVSLSVLYLKVSISSTPPSRREQMPY